MQYAEHIIANKTFGKYEWYTFCILYVSLIMIKKPTYDIALSFAGEDRSVVEEFAKALRDRDVSVFYDHWKQSSLWGKDLYQYLAEIYSKTAKFCVIFISDNYVKKAWTSHELKHAQARAFEKNREYILPVKLADTELPGLPPTIGYMDLRKTSVHQIANLVLQKLHNSDGVMRRLPRIVVQTKEERLTAILYAAFNRDESQVDKLCMLLTKDDDREMRAKAAWALDNISSIHSISCLIQGIHDEDWTVCSNAGWALVHLGSAAERKVKQVLTSSTSGHAKEMARLILERMG